MSILPRSQGSQVAYSTASYNVAYAAGIQAGDLMIVFASTSNLAGGSAGWTAGPTAVNPGNIRIQSFWKRATGGESGSVTFSTASGSGTAYMTVLSGVVSTGVPYVNSSVGSGTGTAVNSGACASVGSSDDGRYFRISAASYFTAQASAVTVGATAYTNVTGYSSSAFTATGTGTLSRSVVSWAGFFTGTTGSNTSAGTLTLPTSSAWAALSFDLLEQASAISSFSDPFTSGYTSYWTASGNQIANDLVAAGTPGEIGIRPSAVAGSEGLWPQLLGAAKSFVGGRLQFRLRGTMRSGHVSTASAGVSSYNGGAISVTLGDGAGNSDLLVASIGGAEAGRVTVNSQTGIWIRITETSGVGTISYSADGQTWNVLATAATGTFDARSVVPFIQVAANSGADASFVGVKWYLGWVNSAGTSRFSAPRINLCPNPTAQIDASNMSGSIVPVRDTSWPANGQSFGSSPPTASNDSYITIGGLDTGGIRSGLKPGSRYVCQATVNVPVALTGTLHARALGISFIYKNPSTGASYVEISSGPGVLTSTATGYALVTLQFTVPADVTEAFVRLYNGADNSSANLVQWTGIILEEANAPGAYFDGDFPACAWLGAAGASFSICYSDRVNQILNPGGEGSDAYDWGMGGGGSGTPGAVVPSSDQARFGGKSLKVSWGTATFLPGLLKATAVRTIPGRRYLFRFSDFASTSQPRMVPIVAGLGFPTPLWGTDQVVNSWRDFTGVFSATGMQHGPGFWPNFQPTGTETTYVDGITVEELTPLAEGDAVSGDGGLGALWAGEPNYSESYYPANGTNNSTQAGALQSGRAAVLGTSAVATKATGSVVGGSANQARAVLIGNTANVVSAIKAASTAANAAGTSAIVRGVGVPMGATHATSGIDLAKALLTAMTAGTSMAIVASSSTGLVITTGPLLGQGSSTGSASANANPLGLGALINAAAISAGSTISVGLSAIVSHMVSSSLAAVSILAPVTSTLGVVNGRGVTDAQVLAMTMTSPTNAVLGQALSASPNVEANGVSGAALASGLVVSGFHGYADGAVIMTALVNIANAVAGSVMGNPGNLGKNLGSGSIATQGLVGPQSQVLGSAAAGGQPQVLGLIIKTAQASGVLAVQSLLSGGGLTSGIVLASDLLQGLAQGVGGGLGADAVDGVAHGDGGPTALLAVGGQALLDVNLQAINSADGQLTGSGWVRGTHGDYLLWDGSTMQVVELVGLWNGSSTESVDLLGLWDGLQLVDQGVIPA